MQFYSEHYEENQEKDVKIYVIKATLVIWREYIGSGEKEAGTEIRNINP